MQSYKKKLNRQNIRQEKCKKSCFCKINIAKLHKISLFLSYKHPVNFDFRKSPICIRFKSAILQNRVFALFHFRILTQGI